MEPVPQPDFRRIVQCRQELAAELEMNTNVPAIDEAQQILNAVQKLGVLLERMNTGLTDPTV